MKDMHSVGKVWVGETPISLSCSSQKSKDGAESKTTYRNIGEKIPKHGKGTTMLSAGHFNKNVTIN